MTNVSKADQYGETYFDDRYLGRGRVLRRYRGDRVFAYAYWERFIRRRAGGHAQVLEIGCGAGFFLSRLGGTHRAFGVDLSWAALRIAASRTGAAALTLASGDNLPYMEGSFDAVVAFDVLEHLAAPERLLAEASRVLRPGGLLIATTPNLSSLGARVKGRRADLDGGAYEQRRPQSFMWRDESHIGLRPHAAWLEIVSQSGFGRVQSGTDCLWDMPYGTVVPAVLQKLVLIPINSVFQLLVGFLPWSLGENLVVVAEKEGGLE